uniref:Uncharacterized protein n=1 Tax=Setaria italica TaxID=4555 RepID=K3ZMX0_SETIT
MEGKRTTALMVIMCLCSCCVSARAKACCFTCIAAGSPDFICKNTCCFPCTLSDSVAAKMEEMGVLAKMEEAGQA